jgi:hypothetical protein
VPSRSKSVTSDGLACDHPPAGMRWLYALLTIAEQSLRYARQLCLR